MYRSSFETRICSDADEVAAAIRTADMQVALRNRPQGPFKVAELALHDGPRLTHTRFPAAFSASARSYPGVMALSWPTERGGSYEWSMNGRKVDSSSVALMHCDTDYVAFTERPISWATLHIPLDLWPLDVTPGSIQIARLPASAMRALDTWARASIVFATTPPGRDAHGKWKYILERLLIPYFEPSFANRRKDRQADNVLQRLNTLLRAHPMEVLHPGDVQRALNVSARQLHEIFQNHFGTSPGRYLRLRRLNNAHRDLKHGRYDGRPVTEVAVNHGFFDIGRFSSAYRQIFSEFPSRTAKRHDTLRKRVT